MHVHIVNMHPCIERDFFKLTTWFGDWLSYLAFNLDKKRYQ